MLETPQTPAAPKPTTTMAPCFAECCEEGTVYVQTDVDRFRPEDCEVCEGWGEMEVCIDCGSPDRTDGVCDDCKDDFWGDCPACNGEVVATAIGGHRFRMDCRCGSFEVTSEWSTDLEDQWHEAITVLAERVGAEVAA